MILCNFNVCIIIFGLKWEVGMKFLRLFRMRCCESKTLKNCPLFCG
jgi:hypothetical protein